MMEVQKGTNRRNIGSKKMSGKGKKKQKTAPFKENKPKIDKRMKKLFQKRARDYNSDGEEDEDEDEDESTQVVGDVSLHNEKDEFEENAFDEEGDGGEENEVSEDEGGEIQPGITRFKNGCKTFKNAFQTLLKETEYDDLLGPVLSAHKKLVAEKLAEEDAERKVKGEAKKEKRVIGERGHVKPATNYLDAHEKSLIGIATKGVVKLFNAVNKAQQAQRGLNPSRARDEKTIKKRKKEAFFSELGKTSSQSTSIKVGTSGGSKDKDGLGWAPLRDNFMLTNPKLKDWDKKTDTAMGDDSRMPADTDSSSDDD